MKWFERLIDPSASKHERGRCRPRGQRTAVRREHKRQKLARRAQRGKR